MRVPRVFLEIPLSLGEAITLPEASSHYLNKVLRMKQGRDLILFNGKGGEYHGTISTMDKRSVTVTLDRHVEDNRQSPLDIHLGIGVSRGDRMDQVIQKATELGVSKISPLFSERCEVKLRDDRLSKKLQHWQQVAYSACEQCQLNIPPVVEPPKSLDEWLPLVSEEEKLVLHHRSESDLSPTTPPKSACVLIGPEGGLTAEEITQAINAGFKELTLGPRVLRTETAPLAAIAILQYRWGDL